MTVHRLENVVQPYAWGHHLTLARMQGRTPHGGPEAELWLGAHPGAPSRVLGVGPEAVSLDDFLAGPGAGHLPDGVEELPFLFKVLAIGGPLSIQVHPDLDQAREGYAREDDAGTPLDDAARSYKDASDKPEVVVALEPMRVLVGLLDGSEREALARDHGLTWLTDLAHALPADLVSGIFALDEEATERALAELGGADLDTERARLVRELLEEYPGDRGVLVAAVMNLVHLEPGQALFTDAGVLHAYVSGTAVEIMNPSDNVLRAGLTPKHVDVEELSRILRDDQSAPAHLTIASLPDGGRSVPLWTDRVGLRHYTATHDGVRVSGVTIALATSGDAVLRLAGQEHRVPSGQAVLVLGEHEAHIDGDLWLASCPGVPPRPSHR